MHFRRNTHHRSTHIIIPLVSHTHQEEEEKRKKKRRSRQLT